MCERWLSRSPIETPTTDRGRRGPGADGATHENHARPLGSHSHRHTRSRKAPQARAANLLFDTREGGGTCARVPGKPVRFFLKREKRDGEPKAEGEPAAGGAHSAAGGSGGAPWRPPQRFRGRPEGKRPKAARDGQPAATRGNTGATCRDKRADLAAGKAAPGLHPRPISHLCPRPRKTGPTARATAKARPASPSACGSLPLAVPSGRVRAIAVPPGTARLANGAGGGNNWGWTTHRSEQRNALQTNS